KDTGDNTSASGLSTDIAGDPRIFNSTVDMGAYEYAPISLTSPSDQTVCPPTTVMFTVTVDSGQLPYTYQWRRNMSNLSDGGAILGSQTPTLTITAATGANDGSYDVVVTDGSTA